tara:strand:- start:1365 stop:2483 length:1119 start_codon:yes stop_codon:yes gene_type:complete
MIKKGILYISIITIATLFGVVIFEGAYSISKTYKDHASVTFSIFKLINPDYNSFNIDRNDLLQKDSEIKDLIPVFIEDKIGIGYSPYKELWTDEVRTTFIDENGCLLQKANLSKQGGYLKSNLFYNFRPLTFWYDQDKILSSKSQNFINKYSLNTINHTSNTNGERITVPRIDSTDKSLIVGDSVALGLMLNDDQTLSSKLQQNNNTVQYINLGISNASSFDNLCNLKKAFKKYSGEINELIYIISDNDYEKYENYIEIEDLLSQINDLSNNYGLTKTHIIYVPYVYNIAPEITRIRNPKLYSFETYPNYYDEEIKLKKISDEYNWNYINFKQLVLKHQSEGNSLYDGLKYYMDDIHLSVSGINLLYEEIIK